MRNQRTEKIVPIRGRFARRAVQCVIGAAVLFVTAWSAVIVKEATVATPLVGTGHPLVRRAALTPAARPPMLTSAQIEPPAPDSVRWFDGKRVRPVRTIWMRVTAYSPDARSCGKFADGKTATMHSVWTNAMRLVAADTRVLPYGSMISVPGYADGEIVPVLDCGGAIKGMRLDVLMPTHAIARRWGVRDIPVTVWADAE